MNKIIIGLFLMLLGQGVFGQVPKVFQNVEFIVEPLNINTVGSDISPSIVDGNLFFSAVRDEFQNSKTRERRNTAFYDVWSANLSSDGIITSPKNPVNGFGFDFHEGPVAWCKSTGELFVTLSNTVDPDTIRKMFSIENVRLRLVIMKNFDGEWKLVEELPFNNDLYHFAHPAISITGDTLIFSSDFQDSIRGNNDLFMSVRDKNRNWSEPINLGYPINTQGNEMFPTFLANGLLSFASDAQEGGFGGLDIYFTSFPQRGQIFNMGDKVNTYHDDFGLILHPSLKTGYFASDRPGRGKDDIYRLDIHRLASQFAGRVIDYHTLEPIDGAYVRILDCDEVLVDQMASSSNGSFGFRLIKDPCMYAEASKLGYEMDKAEIGNVDYVELRLKRKQSYSLWVLDVETLQPIENALVICDSQNQWVTDSDGMVTPALPYNFKCLVKVSADGYLNQTKSIDVASFIGELTLDTVWLYRNELNKTFVLDNIYYDFDKWDILPESEIELEKLIKIMNDNPSLKVELGSHTDARGSDEYNRKLSQRRSDSAVGYIIGRGIPQSRIVAKGYGESQLINQCANGIPCSDEEHRRNRRTEFKIIGL